MKDLKKKVRDILEELGAPASFKNFMSMRKWWSRNHPDISERLFELYDKCNEIYDTNFKDFLLSFAFDVKNYVCHDYSDVFITRKPEKLNAIINRTGLNQSKVARDKILKAKEECDKALGYETRSIQELKYCIINKIESLPTCQQCGGGVEFNGPTAGFRKFCSAKCQNIYHNSQKPIGRVDLSDDEVRDLISSVGIDHRNLHNETIASCFDNVIDYSNTVFKPLKVNEALYIFLNKLTTSDVMCPVCEVRKRKFISQGRGYLKTCGCKSCVYGIRHDVYYEGTEPVSKGPYSIHGGIEYRESGFIYIIKSEFSGLTKIGVSQDPVARIKAISRDIEDVELVNCFYIKSGLVNLEKFIHDKYRDKQVLLESQIAGYTEWFRLDESDVTDIEEFINELHSKF